MEIKIKREELVRSIRRLRVVEELPRDHIEQFSKLMKVKEDSNDLAALINGFQNRVVDIFCQEGEAYEDYLQLPKFRSMNAQLQRSLNHVFATVWRDCHENRHKQHLIIAKKQVEQMTTLFKNKNQAEKFHLGLLKLFRDSPLCPRIKSKPSSTEPDQRMLPENNFPPPNQPRPEDNKMAAAQNPNVYQCFPYGINGGSYAKMEAQEGMGYIMQKEQPQEQPLFDVPRYPMHTPPPPFFTPDFFQNGPMNFQEQNGLPFQGQGGPQNKNMFGEEMGSVIMKKFSSYEFIQCVCEGKYGFEYGSAFRCACCHYSYHFNCLKIERSSKEEVVCPICNLKKETIFCKVVQEPMKFSWYLQERSQNQFRLEMSEEESQQIVDAKRNGLDCQIRFLKIDGKSLRREKKSQEGFITQNGILHKQKKHSEITLPEFNQDQTQPVSLDIMLRSDDDHGTYTPKLYFFSVFLVSLRKVDEIVMELFDSNQAFDETYYQQFFGSGDRLEIKYDECSTLPGLIRYPVRGTNCQHPQVFDYKKYLQFINDLKQDRETELLCPICSKVCHGFKYDSFIYQRIIDYPDYEQKEVEGIEIHRDGQSFWKLPPQFILEPKEGPADSDSFPLSDRAKEEEDEDQ